MIIDIGTGVDESVVKWKYNDKDKWRDADIDELIHLYESVVHCKDCRHANECHKSVQYTRNEPNTVTIGYSPIEWCSRGERREE